MTSYPCQCSRAFKHPWYFYIHWLETCCVCVIPSGAIWRGQQHFLTRTSSLEEPEEAPVGSLFRVPMVSGKRMAP